MGHLSIVNQKTIKEIKRTGHISVRGNLNKNWIKTTADIFSDILTVRKGDLIFPWIINSEDGSNLGFKYVFKVSGDPIFVKGDEYPVKVPLEKEGRVFEKPVSESEALDLWRKKILWNAIGKKSLGRGRSLTHQTKMEDEVLLKLLNKKNNNSSKKISLNDYNFESERITINTNQNEWEVKLKDKLESLSPENRLSNINLKGIPWVKNRLFRVEKVLEAWITENIDKEKCEELRKIISKDWKIEWFGNYLPFGVQGSNMDIVLIEAKENKKRMTLIELKVDTLNQKQFEDASNQSINYSFFMNKAMKAFGFEDVEINPIVIAGGPKRNTSPIKYFKEGLMPKWISYEIKDDGKVKFSEIVLN